MLMMMMMMNCFCGMVDRRKAFSLISSRDYCQRSSPSRISDTPRAGFEPAQNRNNGLERHISFMNNIDIANEKFNKKSNFSPKEWTELRNLINQLDILIK